MRNLPIIHTRALGSGFTATPRPLSIRRLGADSAALDQYQQAKTNLDGVKKTYQQLVYLIGSGKAAKALEEANSAFESARAAAGQ